MKPPTLEENLKTAKIVFVGTVLKQVELGKAPSRPGTRYRLNLNVAKSFKGIVKGKIDVFTESNSCNTFGQNAAPGYQCLVLLNSQKEVISGVLAGEASECASVDSPRLKELMQRLEGNSEELN